MYPAVSRSCGVLKMVFLIQKHGFVTSAFQDVFKHPWVMCFEDDHNKGTRPGLLASHSSGKMSSLQSFPPSVDLFITGGLKMKRKRQCLRDQLDEENQPHCWINNTSSYSSSHFDLRWGKSNKQQQHCLLSYHLLSPGVQWQTINILFWRRVGRKPLLYQRGNVSTGKTWPFSLKKKGTHTSLILFCFLCFSSSTLKFHREVKQTNKMALLNQQ